MNETEKSVILDEEHLRLLVLCYYITAGVTALFACMPLIHVALGIMMVVGGHFVTKPGDAASVAVGGWLFIAMGSIFILLGWGFALTQFLAGRFIAKRQHRVACLILAGGRACSCRMGRFSG
jgi:hypothetical protein